MTFSCIAHISCKRLHLKLLSHQAPASKVFNKCAGNLRYMHDELYSFVCCRLCFSCFLSKRTYISKVLFLLSCGNVQYYKVTPHSAYLKENRLMQMFILILLQICIYDFLSITKINTICIK